MEEKNTLKELLWNLSGFEKKIISQCKVDGYHAAIIGTLLLIVGIYATLAWTFFFQTVTTNPLVPIIAGLFMGFYIISFDRTLIASMSSGNTSVYSVAFRLLLAGLLGIFLAQPMILKFYEGDISREAQILVDNKNQERKKELQALYAGDLAHLTARKTALETELKAKEKTLSQAETDFKKEMDGSAGTGKWGYNTVSQQKEKIAARHQQEFTALSESLKPQIDTLQAEITKLRAKIAADFEAFKEKNTAFGTLVQAEALESLLTKDKSGSLKMRYYLLAFILALIELSALIAKMLFDTKSYKSTVSLITEEEVKRSENDKEIALAKLEEYRKLAMETESELLRKFFAETRPANEQKLDELIREWKGQTDVSYKELYEAFRRKFMVHE